MERHKSTFCLHRKTTGAREFSRVFYVPDALDECRLKGHRVELLGRVFALESLTNVHVMATSRIDSDIASRDTTMEKPISAAPDDMLQYIQKVMMTGFEFKFHGDTNRIRTCRRKLDFM